MIGSVNPAVFPVPVCARPIRSRPSSAIGMACCWIGVGLEYPASCTALRSSSRSPRSAKLASFSGVFFSVFVLLILSRNIRRRGGAEERSDLPIHNRWRLVEQNMTRPLHDNGSLRIARSLVRRRQNVLTPSDYHRRNAQRRIRSMPVELVKQIPHRRRESGKRGRR